MSTTQASIEQRAADQRPARGGSRPAVLGFLGRQYLLLILIVLAVAVGLARPSFWNGGNLENVLFQAVQADYIPDSIMNVNQVGIIRQILVGLMLMALMIFRPQGLFGDKKELALDAR